MNLCVACRDRCADHDVSRLWFVGLGLFCGLALLSAHLADPVAQGLIRGLHLLVLLLRS